MDKFIAVHAFRKIIPSDTVFPLRYEFGVEIVVGAEHKVLYAQQCSLEKLEETQVRAQDTAALAAMVLELAGHKDVLLDNAL